MGSWIDAIEAKARIIHQELQTARALAVRMGQEPDAISGPYLDMLAKLYREDFAYASLADQADKQLPPAADYGVSHGTIGDIKRGRCWQEVKAG